MITGLRRSAGVVALACVLAHLPFAALAADPAGGTLSVDNPEISFETGPHFDSNLGDCEVAACDDFILQVQLPGDYASSHPGARIVIDLEYTVPGDLDMLLLNADGSEADNSGAPPGLPEHMDIPAGGGSRQLTVRVVPYLVAGTIATVTIRLDTSNAQPVDPCQAHGLPNDGSAELSPGLAKDLARLPTNAAYGAFVHFSMGQPQERRALLENLGFQVIRDYHPYSTAVFAIGTVGQFKALMAQRSVSFIEENRALKYMGDTGPWATRVRVAHEAALGGPYRTTGGTILRGEGVSVAVVDSGLNAAHRDFQGRVLHNYKVFCPTPRVFTIQPEYCPAPPVIEDVGDRVSTDTTGGHGTHVAGIVAGDGALSTGFYLPEVAPLTQGTFTGAAPGASLISYGVGETLLVFFTAEAFTHILDNYDSFNPRVRVVTNSWGDGAGSAHNPAELMSCLTKALVKKGSVVAFAAGNGDDTNDGGDGSDDRTSSYCKDPTPGVICVANYNDNGSGSLSGSLSGSSSRGWSGKPETYPDIAAPGTDITATCSQVEPGQAVCTSGETRWAPWYGTISGTSMATPHVAGAIALLFQARPDLKPAQVESLLQRTARKVFSNGPYERDPQNPEATVNFGFGAGLLDLKAALDSLGVAHDGVTPAGAEQVLIDGDQDPGISGASDVVRLTVQESSPPMVPGLTYRLTLRDFSHFTDSALAYELVQNVNGAPFRTRLSATASTIEIPAPDGRNSAVASSVTRDGNVVSFFLPYSQLSYPPVGSPIHNIRVLTTASSGTVDFAPSPAGSRGGQAELQPMFGKPFTVQRQSGEPFHGDPCVAPGVKLLTDPFGDVDNGLPTSQDDLLFTSIGESAELPNHLVFTTKVDNLRPVAPTNHRWITYFTVPDGTEYWVGMSTAEGIPQYLWGTSEVVGLVRVFFVEGELDAASGHDADGTIRLVLDKAAVGLKTGDRVTNIVTSIRRSTPDTAGAAGLTVDTAAAFMDYQVVGNGLCAGIVPQHASGSGLLLGGSLGVPALLVLALGAALRRRRVLAH